MPPDYFGIENLSRADLEEAIINVFPITEEAIEDPDANLHELACATALHCFMHGVTEEYIMDAETVRFALLYYEDNNCFPFEERKIQ